MGWLFSLIVVTLLVAFNVYVADGLLRMQRDVRSIHKLVQQSARLLESGAVGGAPQTPPASSSTAGAAAAGSK